VSPPLFCRRNRNNIVSGSHVIPLFPKTCIFAHFHAFVFPFLMISRKFGFFSPKKNVEPPVQHIYQYLTPLRYLYVPICHPRITNIDRLPIWDAGGSMFVPAFSQATLYHMPLLCPSKSTLANLPTPLLIQLLIRLLIPITTSITPHRVPLNPISHTKNWANFSRS
jgi:hypothetical protein